MDPFAHPLRPYLQEHPCFCALPPEQCAHLLGHARLHIFQAEEAVFWEGETAVGLWWIESGTVKIYKTSPEGGEHILHLASPGETFNDIAVYDSGKNPANVATLTPAKLWLLPTEHIQALLAPNITFAQAIIHTLAQRIRGLTRQIEDLTLHSVTARFLALVGPSGSGKSSLLRAGLIPRLRQGALPGSAHWYVLTITPGAHPFDRLAAALLHLSLRPLPELADRLRQNEACLGETAVAILPGGAELCLIVDQFEELYTTVTDAYERERFLHMLVTAVTSPTSRVRVLLGLRADFYDRPLMHPDLSRLLQRRTEVIVPLTTAELTEAIEAPARRVGVALQEGLTAVLVVAVNEQPAALPLLQYALTELFQRRNGRLLTHAAYESIGGVSGALVQQAEATYLALEPVAQAATRQIFLRLVTLQEGGGEIRQRVPQAELFTAVGETIGRLILAAFGSQRLLTFDSEPATRQPTVEVAHEALLRLGTPARLAGRQPRRPALAAPPGPGQRRVDRRRA